MLILFSWAVISRHFSSISPGRNLSPGCSSAGSISTRAVLYWERGTKNSTHTHTERALSLSKFGVEWLLSAQPQQLQSSLRWSTRLCAPTAPPGRAPGCLAALQLYKYSDYSTSWKHGAQSTLKTGRRKAGQGEEGAQATELCLRGAVRAR